MRRTLPFIALLVFAAPASAQSGGADVPPYNGPVTQDGGGAVYEPPKPKARKPTVKKPQALAPGAPAADRCWPPSRSAGGCICSARPPPSRSGSTAAARFATCASTSRRPARRRPASARIKLGPLARGTTHRIRADRLRERDPRAGRATPSRVAAKDCPRAAGCAGAPASARPARSPSSTTASRSPVPSRGAARARASAPGARATATRARTWPRRRAPPSSRRGAAP